MKTKQVPRLYVGKLGNYFKFNLQKKKPDETF